MSLSRAQMALAIKTFGRAAPTRTRPFEPIPPKPVTLPPITLRDVSDQDIGLPHDPVAQDRAERFMRAAIAYQMRKDQAASRVPVATMPEVGAEPVPVAALARKTVDPVHVTVPDDALTLIDPTDDLSEDEAGIVRELKRIAALPRARWLS